MQEGDIIIYRNNEAIATVPITPSATKEWKLMERDCCTLVFNVTEPIYFQIGDYISYGGHKYYISEEPLPADYSNGVYKHTLQFDRDYMLWKNITFQMTHIKHVDGTDNYVRTRNEVSWSLTDVLEKHIQELIYNVEISGAKVDERYVAKYVPGPGGGVLRPVYRNHIAYCVDGRTLIIYDPLTETFSSYPEALTEDMYFSGVESRKEMAFIQYNGTDLLSALKTICETYHCEWWVKTITPNPESQPIHPEPYFVLCLGKCEYGDYIDFKMTPEGTDYADLFDADNLDIQDADDSDIHTADINSAGADGVINVEKMSLARNTEEYANRLYVFGSTKNLPDTYRKKLEFEANTIEIEEEFVFYQSGTRNWWYGGQFVQSREDFKTTRLIPVTPGMTVEYSGYGEGHFDCIVGFATMQDYEISGQGADVLSGEGHISQRTITIPSGIYYIIAQSWNYDNDGSPVSIRLTTTAFEDSSRKLSRSMIVSNNDFDAEKDSTSFDISSSTGAPNGYFRVNLNDLVVRTTGKYQISFPFSCFVTNKANHPYVYTPWDYAITIDGTRVYYYAPEQRTTLNGESLSIGGTALFETELTAGTHDFQLTYRFHLNESAAHRTIGATAQIDGSLSARYSGNINTTLTFDGNDYPIILASWIDNWKGFAFSGSAPTGFGVGSKYSIAEVTDEADGLSTYKVPSNYYSYDNGSINSVYLSGERRLQLPITEDYPEGIPYIDPEETITAENLVEKVVIFDDIFPKCALRIIAIKEYVGNVEVETYADGTSKYEETANYFIAVKLVTVEGDKDFPFKEDMRIDGTNLQIKFLTQDEEKKYTANGEVYGDTEHGYQLSGLTFDVAYVSFVADTDGARYKGFQIARNKDFGAMFPNLNRKPTVGDTLVLSGWNVKAMQSLGLITQAENELKTAGYAYKVALKNDLFTFDCTMMSDWMQSRINNDWVGQKARVFHRSLKDKDNQTQTKESRVIGYQMKLDIPYDSPVLTIGETEAYSRLKALERALNGETRNASTGGAINASITPGGGGSGNAEWGAEHESVINLKVGDVTKALVKIDALEAKTDLLTVWESLRDNSGDFANWLINIAHIPNLPYTKITGLGAAATYAIGSVASGNNGLVTGGSVYSAINSALSSAIKYQGITTTALTDGATTNPITIDGASYTAKKGDEVIYGGKEFLWTGSKWQQLGDEESWALKTITISAGTGLTGGGTLAQNRTISLSQATIASLALADTAVQPAGLNGYVNDISTGTGDFISGVSKSGKKLTFTYGILPKINGYALTSDVNLTKSDVGLANVDNLAASDYFTLLENDANQVSITVGETNKKLTIAYASAAGNASKLENHSASYFATATGLTGVSNRVTTLEGRINWDDYFGIDNDGNIYVKKDSNDNPRNFYSFGAVTAGGVGSGGSGGGIDLERVWESLTNNTDKPNVKINTAHIPDMASIYGYLKGNQNITLTGVVTGSGTTSIATSIADGALSIAKVNGLQTALDGKQPLDADLTAIAGLTGTSGFLKKTAANTWALDTTSYATSASLANYVTLDTNQEISGTKEFSSWILFTPRGGLELNTENDTVSISAYEDGESARLNIDTPVRARSFIRLNGTSSQFLKADGSVDGNSYALASSLVNYVTLNTDQDVNGEKYFKSLVSFQSSVQFQSSEVDFLGSINLFNSVGTKAVSLYYARLHNVDTLKVDGNFLVDGSAWIYNDLYVEGYIQSDSYLRLTGTDGDKRIYFGTGANTPYLEYNSNGFHFSEGVYSDSYITAGTTASSSDKSLKESITDVTTERAISVLKNLKPKEWIWNDKNAYLSGRIGAGLVAQDVQSVLPFAVVDDGRFLALNYNVLHAYEIVGLKNHEDRIAALESKLLNNN